MNAIKELLVLIIIIGMGSNIHGQNLVLDDFSAGSVNISIDELEAGDTVNRVLFGSDGTLGGFRQLRLFDLTGSAAQIIISPISTCGALGSLVLDQDVGSTIALQLTYNALDQGLNVDLSSYDRLDMEFCFIEKGFNLMATLCDDSSCSSNAIVTTEFMDNSGLAEIVSFNFSEFPNFELLDLENIQEIRIQSSELSAANDVQYGAIRFVSSILPIQLLEFQALALDGIVSLKWSTGSEINSEKFLIERSISKELNDWRTIGTIKSKGGPSSVTSYNL